MSQLATDHSIVVPRAVADCAVLLGFLLPMCTVLLAGGWSSTRAPTRPPQQRCGWQRAQAMPRQPPCHAWWQLAATLSAPLLESPWVALHTVTALPSQARRKQSLWHPPRVVTHWTSACTCRLAVLLSSVCPGSNCLPAAHCVCTYCTYVARRVGFEFPPLPQAQNVCLLTHAHSDMQDAGFCRAVRNARPRQSPKQGWSFIALELAVYETHKSFACQQAAAPKHKLNFFWMMNCCSWVLFL